MPAVPGRAREQRPASEALSAQDLQQVCSRAGGDLSLAARPPRGAVSALGQGPFRSPHRQACGISLASPPRAVG